MLTKDILKRSHILIYLIFVLLIGYNLYLGSLFVLHGELNFNTDIARDFLLVDDIVTSHKPALIGPRSGGIPGLFHGPLWMYMNLPVFILGGGDPVMVGWFWVGLIGLLAVFTYIVGEKVFGRYVGLFAAALISIICVPSASSLMNPFGAMLFSPLFFYFMWAYAVNSRIRDLAIGLFLAGVLIQFQIAFGAPMLVLTTLYFAVTKKKLFLRHVYAYAILLLPLSTYILFDVRHQFLQLTSLLTYIQQGAHLKDYAFTSLLYDRLLIFQSTIFMTSGISLFYKLVLFSLFAFTIWKARSEKDEKRKKAYALFVFLFLGYWTLTLFYRAVIWSYYTSPFFPLLVLIFVSHIKTLNKQVFIIGFIFIYLSIFKVSQSLVLAALQYPGTDVSSWIFNKKIAETVFSEKEKEFGYYVFSPDEFGYSPRYAMKYIQRRHQNIVSKPYEKRPTTYLLISPPGGKNNSINGDWWKLHKVNIKNTPAKVWKYSNGFRIEKHSLSKEDLKIPSDPNLISDLSFR